MRYHAIPQTVFFRNAGRTTPRISWRIIDVDAGINDRAWPRKCVATANDEATGRRIADMMNGTNLHASHWQAQAEIARANALALESRWHATLDHTNRLLNEAREAAVSLRTLLDSSIAEASRLRNQLFETREQRDEARDILKHGVLGTQQPETDEALRGRLKKQGVYPRDEWRMQTGQGHNLDKLADEYGLRRCPGVK